MGKIYLYYLLQPQSLVASSLDPSAFGRYMTGNRGRAKPPGQQKIFFELQFDIVAQISEFNFKDIHTVFEKNPEKKSEYIDQYGVLEFIPLNAFLGMYLTTMAGEVLKLNKGEYTEENGGLHLYQTFAPRALSVVSRLNPSEHLSAYTDHPIKRWSFPKMVMVELKLNGLKTDPIGGDIGALPYKGMDNLRYCLETLVDPEKKTKMVDGDTGGIHWRTILNGFFVGTGDNFIYYQFPTIDKLETEFFSWWKQAREE